MNRSDAMDVDLDAMHDDVRVDEKILGFVEEEGEEELFSKSMRPSCKPKKKSEISETSFLGFYIPSLVDRHVNQNVQNSDISKIPLPLLLPRQTLKIFHLP